MRSRLNIQGRDVIMFLVTLLLFGGYLGLLLLGCNDRSILLIVIASLIGPIVFIIVLMKIEARLYGSSRRMV